MNNPHPKTNRCGFDRNATHSLGRYVCACGWTDYAPEPVAEEKGLSSPAAPPIINNATPSARAVAETIAQMLVSRNHLVAAHEVQSYAASLPETPAIPQPVLAAAPDGKEVG